MTAIACAFLCGAAFVVGAFVSAVACAVIISKENQKKTDALAQHYADTTKALEAKAAASADIASAIREMTKEVARYMHYKRIAPPSK